MDARQCRLTALVAVATAIGLSALDARSLHAQNSQNPQTTRLPIRVPVGRAPGPAAFVGSWDYNAEESVDAATGRPEQSPAQRRRPLGGAGNTGQGRPTGGGPPGAFGPGSAGGANAGDPAAPIPAGRGGGAADPGPGAGFGGAFGGFTGSPTTGLERADAIRDLLEVPERLTIAIADDTITFIDDLNRARTYLTDNRKKKYQLGAATYNAKTRWDGPQLKQEVSTSLGLKIQQTFFLSEDAKRLFVVIRIGDLVKGEKQPGVNRVYDRIDRP